MNSTFKKMKTTPHNKRTDIQIQEKSDKIFGFFKFQGRNSEKYRKGDFLCTKHNFLCKSQDINEHIKGSNACKKCNGRDLTLEEIRNRFEKKFDNKIRVLSKQKYSEITYRCNLHPEKIHTRKFNAVLNSKYASCIECEKLTLSRLSIKTYQDRIDKNPNLKNKYIVNKMLYAGTGKTTKAKIICCDHPKEDIIQRAPSIGKNRPPCPKCKNPNFKARLSDKKIIQDAVRLIKLKYPDYKYRSFLRKLIKERNREIIAIYIRIQCERHGTVSEIPFKWMKEGRTRCNDCITEKKNKHRTKLSYENFKNLGKSIHNNRYQYPPVPLKKYPLKSTKSKLIVYCIEGHGEFKTTYTEHIINKLGNCPKCNGSDGEQRIMSVLEKNQLSYFYNHSFEGLIGNSAPLKFDFFIKNHKLLIEFDGSQHFEFPHQYHKTELDFKKYLNYDRRKNNYAKKNKINLLRIPHTLKHKIENEIEKVLEEINNRNYVFIINEELIDKK